MVADGSPPDPIQISTYNSTARPGSRAPHAWLKDGRSMLDLFRFNYTLLHIFKEVSGLDRIGGGEVPVTSVFVDDPTIHKLYGADLVLVRPDGHVAWRGNKLPSDIAEFTDRIRGA